MVKLTLEITMPDGFLQAFLQHVRDFDIRHDLARTGLVQINLGIEAPDIPADAMQAIFASIHPPFEIQTSYPSGKASA